MANGRTDEQSQSEVISHLTKTSYDHFISQTYAKSPIYKKYTLSGNKTITNISKVVSELYSEKENKI